MIAIPDPGRLVPHHGAKQPAVEGRLRLTVPGRDLDQLLGVDRLAAAPALAILAAVRGLDVEASYGGEGRRCRGRGKAIDASQGIEVSSGDGQSKSPLYCRLLRSMMEDQVAWIRDRGHPRVVTEVNGRDSLALACEADALAQAVGGRR